MVNLAGTRRGAGRREEATCEVTARTNKKRATIRTDDSHKAGKRFCCLPCSSKMLANVKAVIGEFPATKTEEAPTEAVLEMIQLIYDMMRLLGSNWTSPLQVRNGTARRDGWG